LKKQISVPSASSK